MVRTHFSLSSNDHYISTTVADLLTANILGNNTKKNGGASTLTKDQLREIREKTEKGQKSEAIVIKQDELERMKATTKITTKEYEI